MTRLAGVRFSKVRLFVRSAKTTNSFSTKHALTCLSIKEFKIAKSIPIRALVRVARSILCSKRTLVLNRWHWTAKPSWTPKTARVVSRCLNYRKASKTRRSPTVSKSTSRTAKRLIRRITMLVSFAIASISRTKTATARVWTQLSQTVLKIRATPSVFAVT